MQFLTAILKQKYAAKNISKNKDIVYFPLCLDRILMIFKEYFL